ncbi:De-etiolated protein 1 Det1-domain-containing protein [Fennellomyces sp. T-0311]|nr:De-etiolated protein 1 Det1-domain-containing protein [Fennellomyces sp. T-0311]
MHIVDHAGVSLYEDQFAVLSIQTQTIHLFRISESGKLYLQQSLGTFLRSDDASILAMQLIEEQYYQELQQPAVAGTDNPLNTSRDVLDHYVHVLPVDEVHEGQGTMDELHNSVENDAAAFLTQEQLETMVESAHDSTQVDAVSDVEVSSLPIGGEHNPLSQGTNGSPNQDQKYPSLHSGLTQAMLSFLYKLFSKQTRELDRQYFYSNYNWFTSLKMWRMQLIGPDQLLIKLTRMPPEFALLRSGEQYSFSPEDERTMFVIFDFAESRIIDMFENCSNKVEGLMLKSADALRNVTPATPYESTPGMSDSEREYFKKKIESWSRADKGGCHQDAMQKLSLYLPRQPNAQPQCPYFDLSLFRYPEKMIAFQNWTRTTLDIISFYCKSTNLLRFRLDTRKSPENTTRSPLTLTMTIPNPQYPFVITRRVITSINETQNVNFHVRV